jgi:hypothetical protein
MQPRLYTPDWPTRRGPRPNTPAAGLPDYPGRTNRLRRDRPFAILPTQRGMASSCSSGNCAARPTATTRFDAALRASAPTATTQPGRSQLRARPADRGNPTNRPKPTDGRSNRSAPTSQAHPPRCRWCRGTTPPRLRTPGVATAALALPARATSHGSPPQALSLGRPRLADLPHLPRPCRTHPGDLPVPTRASQACTPQATRRPLSPAGPSLPAIADRPTRGPHSVRGPRWGTPTCSRSAHRARSRTSHATGLPTPSRRTSPQCRPTSPDYGRTHQRPPTNLSPSVPLQGISTTLPKPVGPCPPPVGVASR